MTHRDAEVAGEGQSGRGRGPLDADHGDAQGAQLLRQPDADLAHAGDDHMPGPRHDAAADQGHVPSGDEVVDDARGEGGGEAHDQERGHRRPEEDAGLVGEVGRRDRRRRPGGVVQRADE